MFRLIDRYLIREIVPYLLLGLMLLTAIIFAQEASRFSELLVVASRNGLPMQTLWRVMAALVPGILVFTLPISLLVGTMVGMGRLSGDSEIIALGASGLSRLRILRPVVLLALIVAAIMLYVTFSILPKSIRNLADLKANQTLVFQGLNSEIKPRVFEESIPQKVLYIEDIDRAQNLWRNIFLVDLGTEQGEMKIVTATSGWLRQGERSDMPELYLRQVDLHQSGTIQGSDNDQSLPVAGPPKPQSVSAESTVEPDKEKQKRRNRNQQNYTAGHFADMTVGLEVTDEKRNEASGLDQETPQVAEMRWGDLINYSPRESEYREWLAEIHKRLALPTACLIFALLGVGFGISNVRTGRSLALLLSLGITIAYYLLALSGQHAAVSGKLPVWLGMWQANIVLGALGMIVLLVQRRPGSDALSALSSLRHIFTSDKEKEFVAEPVIDGSGFETAARKEKANARSDGETGSEPRNGNGSRKALRRILGHRLLDRLVLSDLARFFLFILGGFSSLFLIITLFQLLDYITRNQIEWTVVANYLFFLLPMIVNSTAPMAALVAVMITFGILQKTSQVVALKASGQSIYRLAAPAVLAAIMLSGVVFLNQDYILPFTNKRQNNLRYLIRKGQEPPQTFYQTTNQWIFGQDSRIFNYSYFDPTRNTFAGLTVLDLSRQPFGIKRRFYARSAYWDSEREDWVLENGWERRFEGERCVFYQPFNRDYHVAMAESPEYFKKELIGSSSLTLNELRRKIADLAQSGFDVLDLKIALQSKVAFPLACLVMVIVGVPFSLSVGKRGALYGVTIGIAIGLVYWGLLGLFEQMGRYEVLPPMLAAWGPNLLFSAGGLYLLFNSRT
jgi:lipopolysaccharide export system permease protein